MGGGSVIDTAKAVANYKNNPEFEDINHLEGVAPTHTKCVPIIALPTYLWNCSRSNNQLRNNSRR